MVLSSARGLELGAGAGVEFGLLASLWLPQPWGLGWFCCSVAHPRSRFLADLAPVGSRLALGSSGRIPGGGLPRCPSPRTPGGGVTVLRELSSFLA